MAAPLIGLAALGAIGGLGKSRAAANQAKNEWLLAEDKRKRTEKDWTLRELPTLHGSEQRKTMGNLFARGMWGNFGRNAQTGAFRSPELAAIAADPWVYRNAAKLAALNPNSGALPKLKGPGVWGTLGSMAGGAAQGAATYYGLKGMA